MPSQPPPVAGVDDPSRWSVHEHMNDQLVRTHHAPRDERGADH